MVYDAGEVPACVADVLKCCKNSTVTKSSRR